MVLEGAFGKMRCQPGGFGCQGPFGLGAGKAQKSPAMDFLSRGQAFQSRGLNFQSQGLKIQSLGLKKQTRRLKFQSLVLEFQSAELEGTSVVHYPSL